MSYLNHKTQRNHFHRDLTHLPTGLAKVMRDNIRWIRYEDADDGASHEFIGIISESSPIVNGRRQQLVIASYDSRDGYSSQQFTGKVAWYDAARFMIELGFLPYEY